MTPAPDRIPWDWFQSRYPTYRELLRPVHQRAVAWAHAHGMKVNGGYIFATDHTIPDSASLADFQRILTLVKTLGAYN